MKKNILRSILSESVVSQNENIDSVMNKIFEYNNRSMIAYGYGVNESFRGKYMYNHDIIFNVNEREGVKDLINSIIVELNKSRDSEINSLNEGLFDTMKNAYAKTKDNVSATTKNITEKYNTIIKFLKDALAKGIDSVHKLLSVLGEMFSKLGDNLLEGLKKLGAFTQDKNEEQAQVKYDDKWFSGMDIDKEQKQFLVHLIAACEMLTSDQAKVKTIMEKLTINFTESDVTYLNEGEMMDKIANNKFLQFILCYGKGKKISWWKSILISIAGSLIISLALPVILAIGGASLGTTAAVCAAVRLVWSTRSVFKVLLNRYVNKKPDENLFNFQTSLLLALCILPMVPPFKDWLQEGFKTLLEKLHLNDAIEKAEEYLNKVIEYVQGKNPGEVIKTNVIEKVIPHPHGGGVVNWSDWTQSNGETIKALAYMGATDDQTSIIKDLLNAAKEEGKSSMKVHKIWTDFISQHNDELLHGMILDSDIHGMNPNVLAPIIKDMIESGKYPDVVMTTLGAEALHNNTEHFAGAVPCILNMTSEFEDELRKKIAEKTGEKLSRITLETFGTQTISDMTETVEEVVVEPVHWLFDTLVASFNPMFIPWLNKSFLGKYEMSIGSNAHGHKYHKVVDVEHTTFGAADKNLPKDCKGDAYNRMTKYLTGIQNMHKELIKQGSDQKSDDNNKKKFVNDQVENYETNSKLDKRNVIIFYVDVKDKKTGKTTKQPAIMMDTLSMLICDLCTYERRRKNPYFMRGLLSKLSFRPIDPKDTKTQHFIHETLGTTLLTSCKQLVSYGLGSLFVEKGKGKKWVPGSSKDANKNYVNLGNFTSSELCDVLNADSIKTAYKYISGEYGANWNVTIKDGKLAKKHNDIDNSLTNSKDTKTIENKKFVKTKDDKYRTATKEEIESPDVRTYDYYDVKIYPYITKDSFIKELKSDDKVKGLFRENSNEVRKGLLKDETFKKIILRQETTFSKDDDVTIKKILKKQGIKSNDDNIKACKYLISKLWISYQKKRFEKEAKRDKKEQKGKDKKVA